MTPIDMKFVRLLKAAEKAVKTAKDDFQHSIKGCRIEHGCKNIDQCDECPLCEADACEGPQYPQWFFELEKAVNELQ